MGLRFYITILIACSLASFANAESGHAQNTNNSEHNGANARHQAPLNLISPHFIAAEHPLLEPRFEIDKVPLERKSIPQLYEWLKTNPKLFCATSEDQVTSVYPKIREKLLEIKKLHPKGDEWKLIENEAEAVFEGAASHSDMSALYEVVFLYPGTKSSASALRVLIAMHLDSSDFRLATLLWDQFVSESEELTARDLLRGAMIESNRGNAEKKKALLARVTKGQYKLENDEATELSFEDRSEAVRSATASMPTAPDLFRLSRLITDNKVLQAVRLFGSAKVLSQYGELEAEMHCPLYLAFSKVPDDEDLAVLGKPIIRRPGVENLKTDRVQAAKYFAAAISPNLAKKLSQIGTSGNHVEYLSLIGSIGILDYVDLLERHSQEGAVAASAIASYPGNVEVAFPALFKALGSTNSGIRTEVYNALKANGKRSDKYIPALAEALKSNNDTVRLLAASLIGELPETDKATPFHPDLYKLLRIEKQNGRATISASISKHAQPQDHAAKLLEIVNDASLPLAVREDCAFEVERYSALGLKGNENAVVLSLKTADLPSRCAILRGIGKSKGTDRAILLPAVQAGLKSPEEGEVYSALLALEANFLSKESLPELKRIKDASSSDRTNELAGQLLKKLESVQR